LVWTIGGEGNQCTQYAMIKVAVDGSLFFNKDFMNDIFSKIHTDDKGMMDIYCPWWMQ
jgi:hypothetical protein